MLSRSALTLLLLSSLVFAQDLSLDGEATVQKRLGSSVALSITGVPLNGFALAIDVDAGPTVIMGEALPLGFSSLWSVVLQDAFNASGRFDATVPLPTNSALLDVEFFLLGAEVNAAAPLGLSFTNGASFTLVEPQDATNVDMAGHVKGGNFTTQSVFFAGNSVTLALDPRDHPFLAGKESDLYLVESKTPAEWAMDATLNDVSCEGIETVTFQTSDLFSNTFVIDAGCASPETILPLGAGYDVVVDTDRDGLLGPGDFIDGLSDRPGLSVLRNPNQPGPFPTVEITMGVGFAAQNIFYPANIASLGAQPLIVISHGNGHNYTWYDHLGPHLASYGYVVMSHANNTGPGPQSAATTTLNNLDDFLEDLPTTAGGILNGHVDSSNIAMLGHSRGGEGVTIAYRRLTTGAFTSPRFSAADIKLVSSIAPTVFNGATVANPGDANYHLWIGSADSDVDGCPLNGSVTLPYILLTRATQQRQSITLQAVGHDAFHNSGGGLTFQTGPNLLSRAEVHPVMRATFLPLVEYHLRGNQQPKQLLHGDFDLIRDVIGLKEPTAINFTFREDPATADVHVIDDFQTQPNVAVASSQIAVATTSLVATEGRFADTTNSFSQNLGEAFNAFTQALGTGPDNPRGGIYEWNGTDGVLEYDFGAGFDATAFDVLSFTSAQAPRHPRTILLGGPLSFEIEIEDLDGGTRVLPTATYNNGIAPPYQRGGCGGGVGWHAEFETIRIPLDDFARGLGIDVSRIAKLRFLFGPSHGSSQGRLGFDHVVFEKE